MLLLFTEKVFTHSYVLLFLLRSNHHHRHRLVVVVVSGAFKLLLLFFTIYLLFLSLSHFRFPHFLFVISYWQFSFSAVVAVVVILNFPSYRTVRCLHTSMYTQFVCVCVYAIHLYYYLRIFTCAFLLLPLFSMIVSIHGISFFFGEFSWVTKLFVQFQWFLSSLIAPNSNCVVQWNREKDNEHQRHHDKQQNTGTNRKRRIFFRLSSKAKQNFLFGKIVFNFLMLILNRKQSKKNKKMFNLVETTLNWIWTCHLAVFFWIKFEKICFF